MANPIYRLCMLEAAWNAQKGVFPGSLDTHPMLGIAAKQLAGRFRRGEAWKTWECECCGSELRWGIFPKRMWYEIKYRHEVEGEQMLCPVCEMFLHLELVAQANLEGADPWA